MVYKHTKGQPFVSTRNDLGYTENFLHMMFAVPTEEYEIDPLHAKVLDLLLILYAENEQNTATSTVRIAGSSGPTPLPPHRLQSAVCGARLMEVLTKRF